MQRAHDAPAPARPWAAYRHPDLPRSHGRILIARALASFTALEWGVDAADIADAFEDDRPGGDSEWVRERTRVAVIALVDVILAGTLRTFCRPFGGGAPRPVPRGDWEIDDPFTRFGWSAFDPERPHDADACPTHWLMASEADMDDIIARLCAETVSRARPELGTTDELLAATAGGRHAPAQANEATIRRAEVLRRTGLKSSTLFAKIAAGTFPAQRRLSPRLSV